jgi:hypothetical protein
LPVLVFPVRPSFRRAARAIVEGVKRFSLAALLAFGVMALARADDGAYRNLLGMAQAAATDKGPDPDDAPASPQRGADALKDAIADAPPPVPAAKPDAPVPAAARSELPRADFAEIVVAAPPRPRLWTRLYATLRPSWHRPAALSGPFDLAVSTPAVRAPAPLPALMPPPDSEAVKAGERRGMAELMSTSAAGSAGQ